MYNHQPPPSPPNPRPSPPNRYTLLNQPQQPLPPESPMLPLPPPSKKQRGPTAYRPSPSLLTSPNPPRRPQQPSQQQSPMPSRTTQEELKRLTDNAISRRREELRRLQQRSGRAGGEGGSEDLIRRARNMTGGGVRGRQHSGVASSGGGGGSGGAPTAAGSAEGPPTPAQPPSNPYAALNDATPSTTAAVTAGITPTIDNRTAPPNPCPPVNAGHAAAPGGHPPGAQVSPIPSPNAALAPPIPIPMVETHIVPPSRDVSVYGDDDDASFGVQMGVFGAGTISPPPPPSSDTNESAAKSKKDAFLNLRNAAFSPAPKPNQNTVSATASNAPPPESNPNTTTTTTESITASSTHTSQTTRTNTTTNTTRTGSDQMRLLSRVNRLTEEKRTALFRISDLEKKLNTLHQERQANDVNLATPPTTPYANPRDDATVTTNATTVTQEQRWNHLLSLASKKGPDAALQWAKQQQQQPYLNDDDDISTATSHRSRITEHRSPPTTRRGRGRRRMKSPRPTGRRSAATRKSAVKPPAGGGGGGGENAGGGDGGEVCPLADASVASSAVETVDDVYSSDVARYYVRKPYGGDETMVCLVEDGEEDDEQHSHYRRRVVVQEGEPDPTSVQWNTDVKTYLSSSTVKDETTLEVICRVHADSSVIRLYNGDTMVHGTLRHDKDGNVQGYDWSTPVIGVEDRAEHLGKVLYIDADGDEGEYWLDTVYEEAVKIRESYCGNVVSAANALMVSRGKVEDAAAGSGGVPITPRPKGVPISPMRSPEDGVGMGVGMPMGGDGGVRVRVGGEGNVTQARPAEEGISMKGEGMDDVARVDVPPPVVERRPPSKQKKEVKEVEEEEEDPANPSDALSEFIIFFFSTLYGLAFFFGLRLPLKVLWWTMVGMVLYSSMVLGWMYLADDNGAMAVGAGVDYAFYPAKMRGFS